MRRAALALGLIALATELGATEHWRIEPRRTNLATTVLREVGDHTFYGFTCFRRRWSFFFNHSPPDGGQCDDHHDCEGSLRRVTVSFVIDGLGERPAQFDLTENTYYADGEISEEGIAAMAGVPAIRLKLDPRLAEAWGIEELSLPMDGLAPAIERASQRCGLRRQRGGRRRGNRRDRR